jgi:hypothetical protein
MSDPELDPSEFTRSEKLLCNVLGVSYEAGAIYGAIVEEYVAAGLSGAIGTGILVVANHRPTRMFFHNIVERYENNSDGVSDHSTQAAPTPIE